MSPFLLGVAVLLPLMLAMSWPVLRTHAWFSIAVAWAPLPAIVAAGLAHESSVDLPWLLLGARWGLDATGRIFLACTAALWLASGIFAWSYLAGDRNRSRFELFWLLTMTGNLGVIVAQDMVSFLLFFNLMSFAAYGLIVHDGKPDSQRAGRIYIVLTVCGEVLLFWAVLLVARQTGSLYFDDLPARLAASPIAGTIVGMLLVGFSIKLGLMPLHVWLPLAHPAAPTPASAVLSGAIIKTGLLGLLRFLPLGAVAMPDWGLVCVAAGTVSALLAALIGLTQDNPKTVLAYSSVSQMGLVAMSLGAALTAPAAWPLIQAALLLFVVHHAIAKAALFLGVGVAQADLSPGWRPALVALGLVVAALALAGLPLTSGFAAKNALKYAATATPEWLATALHGILALTGITTTILVGRFLFVAWPSRQRSHGRLRPAMAIPWATLVAGVVVVFLVLVFGEFVPAAWTSLSASKVWAAIWPMIGAAIILLPFFALSTWLRPLRKIRIPAGDLVVLLARAFAWPSRLRNEGPAVVSRTSELIKTTQQELMGSVAPQAWRVLSGLRRGLESDLAVGMLLGLLAVAMWGLLAW